MDAPQIGLDELLPRMQWTRRGFVVTSLASGFALSVQPVTAQTIARDTNGLDAGEVKVPVADGSIPAYRAMPAQMASTSGEYLMNGIGIGPTPAGEGLTRLHRQGRVDLLGSAGAMPLKRSKR